MTSISDAEYYCSFCGEAARKVRRLFASNDNQHCICNSCVDLCAGMLVPNEAPAAPEAASVALHAGNGAPPSPREIKAFLDQYVIDQDEAKQTLAVAVHNHYTRLNDTAEDGVELDKANILLCGPTGVGKTLLAQTIARMLDVPFVIADATSLTEAGYVGDDVETVLTRLLQAAEFDVARAERGIIFLDEVDKKTARDSAARARDVSGEGVQQALLKLLEGSEVMVSPSPSRRSNVDLIKMNTRNILFILGGAFVGLDKVVERALRKDVAQVGFLSGNAVPELTTNELLRRVEPEHLISYGLIPELVGRVPVIAALADFNEAQLVRVLTEPKNALIKQYCKLFRLGGVELEFDAAALAAIARIARGRNTGARALRSVIERRLMRTQYELPDLRQRGATRVLVGRAAIADGAAPEVFYDDAPAEPKAA